MERVMLKDMTTLEDEAKIEREQGKLAQKKIACLRSLYVNSVKENLPFFTIILTPRNCWHFACNIEKVEKIHICQKLTAGIFYSKSSFTVFLSRMMILNVCISTLTWTKLNIQ